MSKRIDSNSKKIGRYIIMTIGFVNLKLGNKSEYFSWCCGIQLQRRKTRVLQIGQICIVVINIKFTN